MKADIWKWFDDKYKVHCCSRDDYDHIIRWQHSRPGGVYYMPDGSHEYDVIIPEEHVQRAGALVQSNKQSRTPEMGTNRTLNDNDLREVKSP
ncbi:MAG TPA: hypothetical protein VMY05_12345 [Acidobacteriota bacterium]|nr:hypothetical protein [Acidobacteriota bacterium]